MSVYAAIFFGLLSMFGFGFSNAFSKPLAKKYGPANVIFLRGIVICLILLVPALFHLGKLAGNLDYVIFAVLLGVAGYLPVLAFTHGIKISRLGVVAPIASTAPLFAVVMAQIFLNSPINTAQWLAILLIIFANIYISFDIRNWRDSNALKTSSGIPYALVAAVGWGLWSFLIFYPTRSLGPYLAAFLAELGVTIAAGFHVLHKSRHVNLAPVLDRSLVANAALVCLGSLALTVGVSKASVAIVVTLSNSPAIISTLIGTYRFHEHLNLKEKIAGSLIIIGVVVLSAVG